MRNPLKQSARAGRLWFGESLPPQECARLSPQSIARNVGRRGADWNCLEGGNCPVFPGERALGPVKEKFHIVDAAETRSGCVASGREIGEREVDGERCSRSWVRQPATGLAIERTAIRPDDDIEINRLISTVERDAQAIIGGIQVKGHGRGKAV